MHNEHQRDRERIARLRTLASELERLPQSRARDQLLRQTHHRTVMVDTGVPPLALQEGSEVGPVALFQNMMIPAWRRTR